MTKFTKIIGHDDRYEISTDSIVRVCNANKNMTVHVKTSGYHAVTLNNKLVLLHTLMASVFLQKPESNIRLVVEHIDQNKANNKLNNLRWTTIHEKLKNNDVKNLNMKQTRGVIKLDDNGKIITNYNSIKEAVDENKIQGSGARTSISACCRGLQLSACGFKWAHYDPPENIVAGDFKKIEGYGNTYEISTDGVIKSHKTGHVMTYYLTPSGYYRVSLEDNVKHVHQIMASVYLHKPKSDKELVIDHIDGIKTNNKLSNLRWITQSENVKNAHKNNPNMKTCRRVSKLDKNGTVLEIYSSINEVIEKNNIYDKSGISAACSGKQLTCYSYKWQYTDKNIINDIKIEKDEVFVNIDKFFDDEFQNYAISNYGKIKNIVTNQYRILHLSNGYYSVGIPDISGKNIALRINRLVAYFFISKEDKSFIVNHKNENKLDNYYKNLEWLKTSRENIIYSTGKKVEQVDINTNKILQTFSCIKDAYDAINKKKDASIQKCCNKQSKIAHGFSWKWG